MQRTIAQGGSTPTKQVHHMEHFSAFYNRAAQTYQEQDSKAC